MRRSELMNLKLHDIDPERGTLFIRQGKGRKDRMVPVGDRALHWITRYRDDIRPQYVREPDSGTLFLTNLYEPFTPNRLTQLVRDYINAAELGKSGSCHLFRHTCGTLMLENGADIRFIQQLLGHAELTTTQIYTQASTGEIYDACQYDTLDSLLAANTAGAGWRALPGGVRIKQTGNYWIKEVNPDASAVAQWWGRGSLNAQARGLDKLGDMAPSHLFQNGKLITRDAGAYTPGNFWSTWAEGSRRLGTPFNDIRPRNIGSGGLYLYNELSDWP